MDIRTLLKSLPATTGMSKNRCFQVVGPNASLLRTIATFKKEINLLLNNVILHQKQKRGLMQPPGQISKVFLDDVEGIQSLLHCKHILKMMLLFSNIPVISVILLPRNAPSLSRNLTLPLVRILLKRNCNVFYISVLYSHGCSPHCRLHGTELSPKLSSTTLFTSAYA